jgi:hypothetical protein
MNRQDLINNLGTVTSSGTQKFLYAIKNSKDSSLDRLLSVTNCGKHDSTLLTQIPYSGQYSLIQSSSTHFNIISQASSSVP